MNLFFTPNEIWRGGFFELAIEIGSRSDDRLVDIVEQLWNYDQIVGCWTDNDQEPQENNRVIEGRGELFLGGSSLYGIATLDDGKRIACGSCSIRENRSRIDWLCFYLPMGALETAYPGVGSYPFASADDQVDDRWLPPIEEWLARLGRHLFERVDFRLGLVGFETSGSTYADRIADQGIPSERWNGYLWPTEKAVSWFPRSMSRRPCTFSRDIIDIDSISNGKKGEGRSPFDDRPS